MPSKLRVLGELAAPPARKPFTRANPKSPVGPGEEVKNFARGKVLIGWRLPCDVSHAVETKQAELCAQPKITIGRLCNGVDGASRKSMADLPRGVCVLADV